MTDEPEVPFVKGSETSKATAEFMKPHVASMVTRMEALYLKENDHRLNDGELELGMGDGKKNARQSSISARRRCDLELKGIVRKTDRKRLNPITGRPTGVYEWVPPPERLQRKREAIAMDKQVKFTGSGATLAVDCLALLLDLPVELRAFCDTVRAAS